MEKITEDHSLWNELSDERKEFFRLQYRIYKNSSKDNTANASRMYYLEELFGEENLESLKLPKTWVEVREMGYMVREGIAYDMADNETEIDVIHYQGEFGDNIIKKAIATMRIHKLIEFGYGGNITDDEWADYHMYKWYITYNARKRKFEIYNATGIKHFIAFRSEELAEEFIEKNCDLLNDFYMVEDYI